jgi:CxxC-x17-CxxC domain-containing protein
MTYTEKSLTCSDCGKSFPFTAEEQEFFNSKGFTNEPKRCPSCRSARRSERFGNDGGGSSGGGGFASRGPRQMFPATCGRCGKQTEVPFQPRGDKPVYCRDCYTKNK